MGGQPSTIGLAIAGAYWLLVILFLLISLGSGILVTALAFTRRGGSPVLAGGGALFPAVLGVVAAVASRPGLSFVLSGAAILFAIWWMHNMAKRE
jgi:hypothetical protein